MSLKGLESKVQGPIWIDLKQIESWSSIIPWSLAWLLVLQIMSFPFSTVCWYEPIDFPSKIDAM
jgi:hypothetical protein